MLVLSRRRGDCIEIGNNVLVKVLEIDGSQVRIGVEAPIDLRINRLDAEKEKIDGKARREPATIRGPRQPGNPSVWRRPRTGDPGDHLYQADTKQSTLDSWADTQGIRARKQSDGS